MSERTEYPKREDGWEEYGVVYDRQATVAVITALQGDGKRVRVVKEGNHNRIYTQAAS